MGCFGLSNSFSRCLRLVVVLLLTVVADPADRHEASMMQALKNCPLCREHEPCLLDCRFAQRRGWKECLTECLKDNPMVRDLMFDMYDKFSSGGASKGISTSSAQPLVRDLGGLQR